MTGCLRVFIIAIFFTGCSRTPTRPADSVEAKTETVETLTIQPSKTLVVTNYIGGIIIEGYSVKDIMIHADKSAQDVTREKANRELENIKIESSIILDSLYVFVTTPVSTPEKKYHCTLNLNCPFHTPIKIKYAEGAVFINQMDSTLIVLKTKYDVTILEHTGSSYVESNGNISISTALPDSAQCRCTTNTGNIFLQIPASTSADVSAKSVYGTIDFGDLPFAIINRRPGISTGVLGSGQGVISLETIYGNISLNSL